MSKKFKVIDASTGLEFKTAKWQCVMMTPDGVFVLWESGDGYGEGSWSRKLSAVLPKYDIIWRD